MASSKMNSYMPTLWVNVGVVFVFVALRLYTRMYVKRQLGWDDHIYTAASVFLLAFAVLMQVAVTGSKTAAISADAGPQGVGWEMLALSVAFIGATVAKCSLGAFLLRFILNPCHRKAILSIMASLVAFSTSAVLALWLDCTPRPTLAIFGFHAQSALSESPPAGIPTHSCFLDLPLLLKCYGCYTVFVDIAFASLPWLSLYSLNMAKSEKLITGASLSLGFMAAVCGIVRNAELENWDLNKSDYLDNTSGFVLWSAAEIFVTMLCNGIPVLRPLVLHWFPILRTPFGTPQASGQMEGVLADFTIGGGRMNGAAKDSGHQFPRPPPRARVAGLWSLAETQSDEEELVSGIERESCVLPPQDRGLLQVAPRWSDHGLEQGPDTLERIH